uniref:hypothetical protein n=1 Tax=Alistipes sp. TaxID=1872444 RepID=UPI004055C5D0
MRKMMFLTLALSVMTVGSAMAMDDAAAADRKPGRVNVDIHIAGGAHNPYAELLHMALCPECRPHRDCCDAHHGSDHRHRPPKRGHSRPHDGGRPHSPEYHHGGGHGPHSGYDGDRGGRGDRGDDGRGKRGDDGGRRGGRR